MGCLKKNSEIAKERERQADLKYEHRIEDAKHVNRDIYSWLKVPTSHKKLRKLLRAKLIELISDGENMKKFEVLIESFKEKKVKDPLTHIYEYTMDETDLLKVNENGEQTVDCLQQKMDQKKQKMDQKIDVKDMEKIIINKTRNNTKMY